MWQSSNTLDTKRLLLDKHSLIDFYLQCRGGRVRKPILPRGMPGFAKCVPVPKTRNPNPKTTLRFCGNVAAPGRIHFDLASGIRPNCGGMACFPTCDDPNQEPR